MKRTFATSALAVVIIGLAACKGGGGEAVKFVPESATFIAGIDFAGVRSSQLWTDNKAMLEAGGGEDLKKMEKCNLGLDKLSRVTVAGDGKSDETMVIVVEGDGVGKKENLECLAKEDDKFKVEEDGKVVKMGNEGVGYVVNDGLIAFAGEKWAAQVKELIDGKGKSAGDGALKDLIARAPTTEHIWFAGTMTGDMAEQAKMATGGSAPKDFSGGINLASGLAAKVSLGMASDDEATKVKDLANAQLEGLKGNAEQLGVPKATVESVKIEADGSVVKAEASISNEDLKSLTSKLGNLMM